MTLIPQNMFPLLAHRVKGSYNCAILHTWHLSCKAIIVKELKLATAPNLLYSICMMCDGCGLYGKFYMGPILVPYGSHMDVPRWVPDESLLQNPHQSHIWVAHIGPI